jgi:hypothetical protein
VSNSTRGLAGAHQRLNLPKPGDNAVRTRDDVVHQPFISILCHPQVAEGRCGYGGSNKAVSAERDSIWKEQLLEPLPLFK